ncbi:MAG: YcxB family protein [Armatimonadota bacterium]
MSRLEYNLTEKDLVEFNIYHSLHSELHLKERRKLRLMVPVIYIILAGILILIGNRLAASVFGVIAIGWYFISPMWINSKYRKHFERHIKDVIGDSISDPITIEVKPDGIFSTSHAGEARYKLSSVEKIAEDDGYTYVYVGKGMAFILPHDRISQSDIDTFIAEIEEHRKSTDGQQIESPSE